MATCRVQPHTVCVQGKEVLHEDLGKPIAKPGASKAHANISRAAEIDPFHVEVARGIVSNGSSWG